MSAFVTDFSPDGRTFVVANEKAETVLMFPFMDAVNDRADHHARMVTDYFVDEDAATMLEYVEHPKRSE